MLDPRFRWRRLWAPAIAVVALLVLDPASARAESGVPVPPNGLLTDRGVGTVTDADRDFVTRVRLAGLWEIPAGDMAEKQSNDPRIQEIGRTIAAQHVVLDELVQDAAKKLKVDLPGKPNSDQQSWLSEMRDATGPAFDKIYIDRLRAAHGKIFPAIATIRASTRNDTVRKLAQRANQFVMTHMTLLESSGIVDFKALPTAPAPSASTSTAPAPVLSAATTGQSPNTLLLLATLAGGLGAGIFATWQFKGGRRKGYRPRRVRGYGG